MKESRKKRANARDLCFFLFPVKSLEEKWGENCDGHHPLPPWPRNFCAFECCFVACWGCCVLLPPKKERDANPFRKSGMYTLETVDEHTEGIRVHAVYQIYFYRYIYSLYFSFRGKKMHGSYIFMHRYIYIYYSNPPRTYLQPFSFVFTNSLSLPLTPVPGRGAKCINSKYINDGVWKRFQTLWIQDPRFHEKLLRSKV